MNLGRSTRLVVSALMVGLTILVAGGQAHAQSSFEKDRAAILAMAGDFQVTFDFTETVSFQADYALKEPKLTDATEIVRVIADTGRMISLQHILVAGEDRKFAIKHWRQDWIYEPAVIWDFTGFNAWTRRAVTPTERTGAWAQLVYQVDDAPRYAGVGRWDHDGGISAWAAAPSWRPLPRRDATTRDDYQVIAAVNRHVITPAGWVHEQDNTKVQLNKAGMRHLAREVGVNTYIRADVPDASVAESYWADTKEFWADIRDEWDRIAGTHAHFGLTIQGEPEPLYQEILGFAEGLRSGDIEPSDASAEAIEVIRSYLTDLPVDGRLMVQP